jgi:hypothetical protein
MFTKKLLIISMLSTISLPVIADSWVAPHKDSYYSANNNYRFDVIPNAFEDNVEFPEWEGIKIIHGKCIGVLYKDNKAVWGRFLINDVAPVKAYIPDSGEYVITTDQWHNRGRLPIAIYSTDKKASIRSLIKVYCNIKELELGDGEKNIIHTASSESWDSDSMAFFGPKDEMFFMRLGWGQWLMIDLSSGNLIKENYDNRKYIRSWRDIDTKEDYEQKIDKLKQYRQKQLKKVVMQRLENAVETTEKNVQGRIAELRILYDIRTALKVCQQEKLKDLAGYIRGFGDDRRYWIRTDYKDGAKSGETKVYFLQQSVKETLEALQ